MVSGMQLSDWQTYLSQTKAASKFPGPVIVMRFIFCGLVLHSGRDSVTMMGESKIGSIMHDHHSSDLNLLLSFRLRIVLLAPATSTSGRVKFV